MIGFRGAGGVSRLGITWSVFAEKSFSFSASGCTGNPAVQRIVELPGWPAIGVAVDIWI